MLAFVCYLPYSEVVKSAETCKIQIQMGSDRGMRALFTQLMSWRRRKIEKVGERRRKKEKEGEIKKETAYVSKNVAGGVQRQCTEDNDVTAEAFPRYGFLDTFIQNLKVQMIPVPSRD